MYQIGYIQVQRGAANAAEIPSLENDRISSHNRYDRIAGITFSEHIPYYVADEQYSKEQIAFFMSDTVIVPNILANVGMWTSNDDINLTLYNDAMSAMTEAVNDTFWAHKNDVLFVRYPS